MKATLYWPHGTYQVIEGEDIVSAMNNAGIGYGALPAIDFYRIEDNPSYQYDKSKKSWAKKRGLESN